MISIVSNFKRVAFTLIELLVVIAIVGILSGLIVISMGGVTNKANIAKAQVFSNSLRNSLMANIVSEWKIDELTTATEGTVIQDSWGGTNNLTLDTYVSTVDAVNKIKTGSDCVSGSCIQLDGTDDYLYSSNTATSLDFGDGTTDYPFTLGGWFKLSDVTSRGLMSKYANPDYQYLFQTYNTDRLYFFQYDDSGATYVGRYSTTVLTNYENQWIYLVATYDGSKTVAGSRIYLNGTRIDDTNFNSGTYYGMDVMNVSFRVGQYSSAAYLSGLVDDIRVFNSVMPASQIKEEYYAGLNKLLASGSITKEDYRERIENVAIENN